MYSSSLTSYPDIIAILDKALASKKGIRLTFENEAARLTFCGRAHNFRHLDRKLNGKIYPADHPMHGCSPYDGISIRKIKGSSPPQVEVIKLEGVEFVYEEIEE